MNLVDKYLSKVSLPQKTMLESIRKTIKEAVPEAEEVITYGMPGFKYKKKYLIAYAPFKDHMSIFPGAGAVEDLKEKLKEYVVSKGTIQFTIEKPLPNSLLEEIVLHRVNDID